MAAATATDTAAWLDAIRRWSYGSARACLQRIGDVNTRGAGGTTALHVAAEIGCTFKIKKLLADRADITAVNGNGETPLMVAQRCMQTDAVVALMLHEELVRVVATQLCGLPALDEIHAALYHPNMQSLRDRTRHKVAIQGKALVHAARTGDLNVVRELVENGGVRIDAVDQETSENAFAAALTSNNRKSVCEYLITHGAHTYGPCFTEDDEHTQITALMAAVRTRDVPLVRLMLRVGPHHRRLPQRTVGIATCVLTEATENGSSEMVDVLMDGAVEFNSYTAGHTWTLFVRENALEYGRQRIWLRLAIACWQQDTQRIQQLFAAHSKELENRDKMATLGAVALCLAVRRDNDAITRELLARGASINQPIDKGATAMVAAVKADSVRMLRLLMDRGGDTSVVHTGLRFGESDSLLSTALFVGAMACAFVLLPLETRAPYQEMALQLAVGRDEQEFVELLLSSLPFYSSETVFRQCVRAARYPVMLDLLLSRCCDADEGGISLDCLFGDYLKWKEWGLTDWCSVYSAHGIDGAAGSDAISDLPGAVVGT